MIRNRVLTGTYYISTYIVPKNKPACEKQYMWLLIVLFAINWGFAKDMWEIYKATGKIPGTDYLANKGLRLGTANSLNPLIDGVYK